MQQPTQWQEAVERRQEDCRLQDQAHQVQLGDQRLGNSNLQRCKLISFIAGIMTIKPGDILFTGTPQGVILGEKTPAMLRRWVKPGDEVISIIEGLGELRVTYQ